MNVRDAEPSDSFRIAEIQIAAWQKAYRGEIPNDYLDALEPEERSDYWAMILASTESFGSRLIVATSHDDVAGFACFGPAFQAPHRAQLRNVIPLRTAPHLSSLTA